MTPKLWAPLNPARRDTSFGTLQSPIRQMVMEILTARKILEEEQRSSDIYLPKPTYFKTKECNIL